MFKTIIGSAVFDKPISELLGIDKVNAKLDGVESALESRLQDIELEIIELEEEHDRKAAQVKVARKARAAIANIFG